MFIQQGIIYWFSSITLHFAKFCGLKKMYLRATNVATYNMYIKMGMKTIKEINVSDEKTGLKDYRIRLLAFDLDDFKWSSSML